MRLSNIQKTKVGERFELGFVFSNPGQLSAERYQACTFKKGVSKAFVIEQLRTLADNIEQDKEIDN